MTVPNDQRRYLRYEIFDYALVHVDDEAEPLHGMVVDIGLGGLQIRLKNDLPYGSILRVKIGRMEGEPLELRGEVRHSAPVPDSDLFAVGMRFVPVTHDERIAIAEFVHEIFQRQREKLLR